MPSGDSEGTKNDQNQAIGLRSYTMTYDPLKRMTGAVFAGIGNENYSIPNISYDKNGNIINLQRKGKSNGTYTDIDNLSYNYNGNQLVGVTDGINGNENVGDFRDNGSNNDYTYWTDGSLKSDANKGITLIEYDSFLRKVNQVNFSSGAWVKFFYTGNGTLIRRSNSLGDVWDYCPNGMIYKNGQPYQLSTPEGRAIYVGGQWVYEFEYRDVWGNLRVAFKANGNRLEATQRNDYDITGFELKPLAFENTATKSNFKFQKQERISDFDLDIDFFKFRPSDSKIVRFWQTDPLASDYTHNSPYALQENKFGLGVELEGKELENFISQFKDPQDLKVKLPDPAKSQTQLYSTTVINSKVSFSEMKATFLKTPEKLLTNSKAEFHAPENAKGQQTGLQKGNTIEIGISGPQNDSYVKVQNVSNEKDKVSATFVTLEGHVERGIINFSVQDNGKNGMTFTISSTSQVDYGLAPEGFARSQQKESWKEVLSNFTKTTGGKETTRIIK